MSSRRIALAVEYNGLHYCGWQRQPHCHSVQAELESAVSRVACQPIVVHCAGRTDAGVHARAQVVHFDTSAKRPQRAWIFGVNSLLAPDVAVHWAAEVPAGFHARFTALSRRYRYSILNRRARPGLHADLLSWERQPLDAARMQRAADCLLGEHDFTSFRSAECQARHAVRTVLCLAVRREADQIHIDIEANGFLHNMVRIIAGCLLKVGRGERAPEWLNEVRDRRDRRSAGMTAPAHGLTFLQPTYPARFAIPDFMRPHGAASGANTPGAALSEAIVN